MTSTPLPEAQTGPKRTREAIFELPSDLDDISRRSFLTHPQECVGDTERVSDEACDDDKEQQFLHLIWGYQSEEREPAGKTRPENIKLENITDTQKDTSKDIMRSCTTADGPEEIPESLLHGDQTQEHSQENLQRHRSVCGENTDPSSASLPTIDMYTQEPLKDQSVTEKRALFLTPRSSTEIQNMMKRKVVKLYKEPELLEWRPRWSPAKGEDKRNRHGNTRSPFKQCACSSPAKPTSDFKRKLCWTPKKSIREAQENDEDSLGMLFTQDSEGFRVIAHRGTQARFPLQDQTNSCEAREFFSIPSVRLLETEDNSDPEPEMLFTQDSQGNVVIKH